MRTARDLSNITEFEYGVTLRRIKLDDQPGEKRIEDDAVYEMLKKQQEK